MSNEEEWRPVFGYEGYYEVSSRGQVRSVHRLIQARTWTGGLMLRELQSVILRPHLCSGYFRLLLSKDNVKQKHLVHALVCEAFHGARPDGHQAAHSNGVKTDNRPDNLRWATPKENMGDQIKHGTRKQMGETQNFAKLNRYKVRAARERFAVGATVTSLAREHGVARSTMRSALIGEHWADIR